MNTGTAVVVGVGLLVVGGVAFMLLNRLPAPQLQASPGNALPAAQFLPAPPASSTGGKLTGAINTGLNILTQGVGLFNQVKGLVPDLF